MSAESIHTELASLLDSKYKEAMAVFNRVAGEQWERTVFSDGEWTIADLLRHIVRAEISMQRLIEGIVAGGSGAPEGFDIHRYNKSQVRKSQSLTPDELKTAMIDNQAATLELLSQMSEDDLAKRGMHGGLGREASIKTIFKIIAHHRADHAADVLKAISNN